jgi:hypothetical protein
MEWENERFLQRLVKRGIKAKDTVWRESWEAVCGGGAHSSDPRNQGKEILAKFIEQNLAHATKQNWAKDLLYYVDQKNENHSSGLESDDDKQNISTTSFKPPSETHPNYRTRLCVNFPLGRCTRGAACAYAHGEAELRALASSNPGVIMQGQFYKTRLCNAFLEGRCTRGAACSYAHSEEERLAYAGGVVKRDAKAGQDIRLEEKRKAFAKARGRSVSRSRSRSRSRREDKPSSASKPLPFIPGRRVDESDL